eukprot:Rhum_TRINITY_DN14748_c13_g1::Rhum_TRINITY_DN14748_c13_g1_i1::g.114691::m.114691
MSLFPLQLAALVSAVCLAANARALPADTATAATTGDAPAASAATTATAPAPVFRVGTRHGQRAAFATRALAKGETVFAVSLADSVVTADGAVAALLSEDSQGAAAHEIASVLSAALRSASAAAASDGESAEETAYTPPHVLARQPAVVDFALLRALALRRAAWGPFPSGAHSAHSVGAQAAGRLLGAFQEERALVQRRVAEAVRVEEALRSSGLDAFAAAASPSHADYEWAVRLQRLRGAASPYGELVGSFAPAFRQQHAGCGGGGGATVQLTLGKRRAEDADGAAETLVGVVAGGGVRRGDELCIRYDAAARLSVQRLLVVHGIVAGGGDAAAWGMHYDITDDAVHDATLSAHGCEPGELLLAAGPPPVLREADFFCYLLQQLPETVRHDHRALVASGEARSGGTAALAGNLVRVLRAQYNATVPPEEAEAFALPDAAADARRRRERRREEAAAAEHETQGRSAEDIDVSDPDVPEVLRRAVLMEREQQARAAAEESKGEQAKEGEAQAKAEGEGEEVVAAVAPSSSQAAVAPEPATSKQVEALNAELSKAVPVLRSYLALVGRRHRNAHEVRVAREEQSLHAHQLRANELTRQQLEDIELKKLLAEDDDAEE